MSHTLTTRFDPKLIDNGALKVPRRALRFAADVQIGDQPKPAEGTASTIPVTVRARSGNVINHFWFGRCVHDFAGMRPASAKLPFDYCHRDDEVLGFSDSQDVTDGLNMHGVLIPFKAEDRVDEVVTKAKAGFEWQGSIYFDPDTFILEFVPEGMTSPVNGGQFEGPGVIFREWMLRGAAICPYGYDPNTSVQLSNQPGDEVAIHFKEPSKMATTTAPGKPAPNRHERRAAAALAKGGKPKTSPPTKTKFETPEEEEPTAADASAEELEGEEVPEAEAEEECECAGQEGCECDQPEEAEEPVEMDDEAKQAAALAARKEAKRFVTAFGANLGGKWFAAGLTFAQAQTKFNVALQAQNKKLKAKVGELSAQVTALGGEDEPVNFTSAEEKPGKPAKASKLSTHLPTGAAKFAATLKLPK